MRLEKQLQLGDSFDDDGRDPDDKTFKERCNRNKVEWLIDIDKRNKKQLK